MRWVSMFVCSRSMDCRVFGTRLSELSTPAGIKYRPENEFTLISIDTGQSCLEVAVKRIEDEHYLRLSESRNYLVARCTCSIQNVTDVILSLRERSFFVGPFRRKIDFLHRPNSKIIEGNSPFRSSRVAQARFHRLSTCRGFVWVVFSPCPFHYYTIVFAEVFATIILPDRFLLPTSDSQARTFLVTLSAHLKDTSGLYIPTSRKTQAMSNC